MATKTWFITGSSRGFGREWAIAALDRGDRVAATARDPRTLDDLAEKYGDALLPMELDVTDRGAVFDTVRRAQEHFGRLARATTGYVEGQVTPAGRSIRAWLNGLGANAGPS